MILIIYAPSDEAYQEAKTYKYLGDKMQKFTKILADLEIGKRHAVETKDYDEAEKIKVCVVKPF